MKEKDTSLPPCPLCGRPMVVSYRCPKCERLVCRNCLNSSESDAIICKECGQNE